MRLQYQLNALVQQSLELGKLFLTQLDGVEVPFNRSFNLVSWMNIRVVILTRNSMSSFTLEIALWEGGTVKDWFRQHKIHVFVWVCSGVGVFVGLYLAEHYLV